MAGRPPRTRRASLYAVLLLLVLSASALAQAPCQGIHVRVLNIKNSAGTVACALFESPEGFPGEYLRYATNVMVIKIRHSQARCTFEEIPPGRYAIGVIHDENMNGILDTNMIGVPKEGYGFSNDASGALGPPPFDAASFAYDGQNLETTIKLNY
jgi:uncharacterized protein (DUF2141 family)